MVHAARGGEDPLIEHGWKKNSDSYSTKKGAAEVHPVSTQKRIYEANLLGLEQLKAEQIIRVFDESNPGEIKAYVEHARKTSQRDYEVYYKDKPFSKYMDEKQIDKVGRYVVTIWIKDDDTATESTSMNSSRRDSFEKS